MLLRGESSAETWSIPMCERTLGTASDERCGIVAQKEATLVRGPCGGAPMLLNATGSGYFVVDYSAEERAAIRTSLAQLTPREEIALHGDEWLLVRYLRRDVGDYLTLAEALPRPAPREIVESIAANLQVIDERLLGGLLGRDDPRLGELAALQRGDRDLRSAHIHTDELIAHESSLAAAGL